jgi:hypothetical protein
MTASIVDLQQRAQAIFDQASELAAVLGGLQAPPAGFDVTRACQCLDRAGQDIQACALDLAATGPGAEPTKRPARPLYTPEKD